MSGERMSGYIIPPPPTGDYPYLRGREERGGLNTLNTLNTLSSPKTPKFSDFRFPISKSEGEVVFVFFQLFLFLVGGFFLLLGIVYLVLTTDYRAVVYA